MNNRLKIVLSFILGAVIFGSIATYATIKIQANEIGYKGGNVETALNDLYDKANAKQTVCMLADGTKETVGAKYLCNPGDGTSRYFYILKVNTDDVELIMEKNITDEVGDKTTMTYDDAVTFFNEENPGYATKQAWLKNVISVDLPSAQDIADAANITGWDVANATVDNWSFFGVNSNSDTSKRSSYTWLYNYTIDCVSNGACTNNGSSAYGYWTKDLLQNDSSRAWHVYRSGYLYSPVVSDETLNGVRPVITVSKSNLAG